MLSAAKPLYDLFIQVIRQFRAFSEFCYDVFVQN